MKIQHVVFWKVFLGRWEFCVGFHKANQGCHWEERWVVLSLADGDLHITWSCARDEMVEEDTWVSTSPPLQSCFFPGCRRRPFVPLIFAKYILTPCHVVSTRGEDKPSRGLWFSSKWQPPFVQLLEIYKALLYTFSLWPYGAHSIVIPFYKGRNQSSERSRGLFLTTQLWCDGMKIQFKACC